LVLALAASLSPRRPERLRDRIAARCLRLILRVLGLLPLGLARGLGRAMGSLAARIPLRITRTTHTNLELCFPRLAEHDRRRMAVASLRETGCLLMEAPMVWDWDPDRALTHVRDVVGDEYLTRPEREGRGVLVAVPHLGNWEIVNHFLAKRRKLLALYSPPDSAAVEAVVLRLRERTGARLVATDLRGIRALLDHLRRGGTVGILPDQEPETKGGVFLPFFGIPALTMTLPARLVRASGALLRLAFARRLPGGAGFEIHIRPVPVPEGGELEPVLVALQAEIERAVLEQPEQYQWEYKRYKTRPPGGRDPYTTPRSERVL
jgi:KDO2-lipid IV(A) lauroyltransferase